MLKRNKCGCPKGKKKGQSTVEYIVLVAAIIAAVIVFVPTVFNTALNGLWGMGATKMVNFTGRLNAAYPNK